MDECASLCEGAVRGASSRRILELIKNKAAESVFRRFVYALRTTKFVLS